MTREQSPALWQASAENTEDAPSLNGVTLVTFDGGASSIPTASRSPSSGQTTAGTPATECRATA
jgi:hypothetical protein